MARVVHGAVGRGAGAAFHLKLRLLDLHIGAQFVHLQPLQQAGGEGIGHVQQDRPRIDRIGGEDEIGQKLALRRQQRGVDGAVAQP